MVIFLLVVDLFFLFFASFDVPSSSIIPLAGGPVTSSLTRAFLLGITSGSFIFSLPLASSWITLTFLHPLPAKVELPLLLVVALIFEAELLVAGVEHVLGACCLWVELLVF